MTSLFSSFCFFFFSFFAFFLFTPSVSSHFFFLLLQFRRISFCFLFFSSSNFFFLLHLQFLHISSICFFRVFTAAAFFFCPLKDRSHLKLQEWREKPTTRAKRQRGGVFCIKVPSSAATMFRSLREESADAHVWLHTRIFHNSDP